MAKSMYVPPTHRARRRLGRIGITGPGGAASAPHSSQVGVGGTTPHHGSGTVTAPPQIPQLPIVFLLMGAG
jgi:hypothetical protein